MNQVSVSLVSNPVLRVSLSAKMLAQVQENLYEIALKNGFSGSPAEFLDSLKIRGEDGATFTPHIKDGVLFFTNNKGLDNPEPVTIVRDYTNLGKIVKHVLENGIK